MIRNNNKSTKNINEVIDYVTKNGGIEYSANKMIEYKNKAMEIIETYPDSEIKTSLVNLINFTTNRNK